jgi:hypothetical protein
MGKKWGIKMDRTPKIAVYRKRANRIAEVLIGSGRRVIWN